MDLAALPAFYSALVPFATTIGTEYAEITADRVALRMPDATALHNHLGGPHAGAMFTLGETASGLVVLVNFGDHMATVTALPGSAEIRYKSVAKGAVTATALMPRAADEVLAEVDRDGRSALDVPVTLTTADGTVTGEMTVHWSLRRTP